MNIITQDLISSHISTFSNKCKTRELACYYLLWLSCNDFPILQVSSKQSKNSCKKKMQLFLVSFSKYLQKPISLTFSSVHTVSALDCTHQSNSRVSKIIKCPASAQPSSTYLYKHIAYCFFFFLNHFPSNSTKSPMFPQPSFYQYRKLPLWSILVTLKIW